MTGAGCIILIGLLAASAGGMPPLAFSAEATVEGPRVALGDIADVSRLPADLRAHAATLALARLQPGQDRMAISTRMAAERARAQMPALAPWLDTRTDTTIAVRRRTGAAAPLQQAACMSLEHPLASGAVATTGDLAPAECNGTVPDAFRYDAALGVARAARDLKAGETVEAPPAFALAEAPTGQPLYVRVQVGDVTIEREVQAIQPTRANQRIFVKTADGVVFSARLREAAP